MEDTALQLNEVPGYIDQPYSFFKKTLSRNGGRKLRRSEILLYATVYSFSRSDDDTATCNLAYSKFEQKLGLSHGTVARGIGALKEAALVNQDKSRRTGASYKCTSKIKENGFIRTEFYLFSTKFEAKGEAPRYLTTSEINVLSLIKTHCGNKKGSGVFTGSVRGIARTLGLSFTIVQKCITTLLKMHLIFRSEENRGRNGYKRSGYTVNAKLLRRTEKNYKRDIEPPKPKKALSSEAREIEAANARAEREHYYAVLREVAENRRQSFLDHLNRDDTYKRVDDALRALPPKIGRAEAFNLPELLHLKNEEKRLQAQRARRMAELGITEEELRPKYRCARCSDTGFKPDGTMCDCYPKRRQTT